MNRFLEVLGCNTLVNDHQRWIDETINHNNPDLRDYNDYSQGLRNEIQTTNNHVDFLAQTAAPENVLQNKEIHTEVYDAFGIIKLEREKIKINMNMPQPEHTFTVQEELKIQQKFEEANRSFAPATDAITQGMSCRPDLDLLLYVIREYGDEIFEILMILSFLDSSLIFDSLILSTIVKCILKKYITLYLKSLFNSLIIKIFTWRDKNQ